MRKKLALAPWRAHDTRVEYLDPSIHLAPDAIEIHGDTAKETGRYESVIMRDDAGHEEVISIHAEDYDGSLEFRLKQRYCCDNCECDGGACECTGCTRC
jgi:hypothetical protein